MQIFKNVLIKLAALQIMLLLYVNADSPPAQSENSRERQNREKKVSSQTCSCLNNGQCYHPTFSLIESQNEDPSSKADQWFCVCPSKFIGRKCEFLATEMTDEKQIQQRINIHEYNYFYYEPFEANLYAFYFRLCFDNETEGTTALEKELENQITFFLQVENETGHIEIEDKKIHTVSSTYGQRQFCKTLYVHYTALSTTKFKSTQKIVLGLKLGDKLTKGKLLQQIIDDEDWIPKENSQVQFEIYSDLEYELYLEGQEKFNQYNKNNKESIIPNNKDLNAKPNFSRNNQPYLTRTIKLNLEVYPFLVQNLLFDIMMLVAGIIVVGALATGLCLARVRFGNTQAARIAKKSKLANSLAHFERYMPAESISRTGSPNSDIECSICLANITDSELFRKPPCGHFFHKECIDSWCRENLTCPMCRRSLTLKSLFDCEVSTQLEMKNSPQNQEDSELSIA